MSILMIFYVLGLIAFMMSGSLTAIKNKMDIGGIIFLSAITGLGGGTIRDILLQSPVFWMRSNWYIYFAVLIGFITFSFYYALKKYFHQGFFEKTLALFDVLGMASFMITTTTSMIHDNHQSILNTILLSVITCVGGGIIRDIICCEIPLVFRSEFQITSVVLGSAAYLAFEPLGTGYAVPISCLLLIITRIFSYHFTRTKNITHFQDLVT